ncbi:radical SAM family heme chaperone HemW [Pantanalinema rosaneae CENA516]|uniref:radical SAM family heme chaperone HemW n=1 Tax=Pantanalinema rosaneae TaxID=1620701 RepID=UPI003D6FE1E3
MVAQSAYVHIPFCRRRCYYCDFPIAVVGDKPPLGGDRINGSNSGTIAHYVEIVCQEIRQTPAGDQALKTIFFGGGTPSLLAVEQLEQILQTLDCQFGIATDAEISMEIDPATFDLAQVKGYRSAGVNRVSLGVQAFQAHLLAAAGRSHTPEDIAAAIDLIHQAGFQNISLDLISGLPYQTLPDWQESLERAIALAPTHISCYDLTVEAGTPFSRQYKPGLQPLPSDETTADMYRMAQKLLTAAGYDHYEISNYAKSGYQCRHNRVYWHNQPFYGFGMGATSYLKGDRFARPRKTWEYYAWVEKQGVRGEGGQDDKEGREAVNLSVPSSPFPPSPPSPPSSELLLDTLMLGLRLAEGLKLTDLIAQFGVTIVQQVQELLQPYVDKGWVEMIADRVCLTDPEGFLFSNVVLVDLFEQLE